LSRELARYKLDLVGVQDVRWLKQGTVRAEDYSFFYERETKIISWEQDYLFVHNRIVPSVNKVEFQ
jgi:hypothetical protein